MAKPFDPRKVLKQIANSLLREFFTRRGELADVPWDQLSEHRIEPVFAGWLALSDAKQREVQMIIRDVNELASAVITFTGISLGVFISKSGAERFYYAH